MASVVTAAAIFSPIGGRKPWICSDPKAGTWIGFPERKIRMIGVKAAKYRGTVMREKQLAVMIEKKVREAKEVCLGNETSAECRVAWDEVEEVSQAKADFRVKLEKRDPLEFYCQENPETDECRIYED